MRTAGERKVAGSIPAPAKKKKKGFFSVSYYFLLISKDGCEKGHMVPQGPGHKCSGGRPGVHLRAISYYTLGSSSLHLVIGRAG